MRKGGGGGGGGGRGGEKKKKTVLQGKSSCSPPRNLASGVVGFSSSPGLNGRGIGCQSPGTCRQGVTHGTRAWGFGLLAANPVNRPYPFTV